MNSKFILIFMAILIFFAFSVQIFAQSDTVFSIDDILNKVQQLSKFNFFMDMYFIRTFDEELNSFSPYLIINTVFSYKFSDFTSIYLNANLGNNGKIDLENYSNNNFTQMQINELFVKENISNLFNWNKVNWSFKIGLFKYDSYILERKSAILDGGTSIFILTSPILLTSFDYSMFSLKLGNLQFNENIIGQLKVNLLNLLTFAFDFYAEKNKELISNIQILFNYINFNLFASITPFETVVSGIDTFLSNLSFRAEYNFGDLKIGKLDFGKFYIAAYYENLYDESFNGHKLSSDFSRSGAEFGLNGKWIEIALSPNYIISEDNFYIDGYLRIKLENIYIELSSNHSPINELDAGYFLKIGTNIGKNIY